MLLRIPVLSSLYITLEAIVSLTLTIAIVTPTLITLYTINTLLRLVISAVLRITNKHYALTTVGLGNIWGYNTKHNTRNVLSLVVYDKIIDAARYRDLFLTNVINYKTNEGHYPYRNLKKIFTTKHGYYCWREDVNFNINNHVLVHDAEVVTETEMFKLLQVYSEDMDDCHPQWQEIIIPRFKYDNCSTLQSVRILRFHHSFGDAGSFIMLYSHCMADGKIPYAVDPLKGYVISSVKKFLYYANAVIFCSTTVLKSVWGGTVVKNNRLVTKVYSGKRSYAWTNVLKLNDIKEIKAKTNCSIPAIIASVLGASLHRFDKRFPTGNGFGPITEIGAVAAILPYKDLTLTNRFTIANFGICTGEMGGLKRLRMTDRNLRRLIRSPEPILNFWMFDFFGMFPVSLQSVLMRSAGTCMVFSNLPGAKEPFYLNGDEVVDGGAWVPLLTVAGLSVSAAGYKDGLRICAGTDGACMSEEELRFVLDTVEREIRSLVEEAVGVV